MKSHTIDYTSHLDEVSGLFSKELEEKIVKCHLVFESRRRELLAMREERLKGYKQGEVVDYLQDTQTMTKSEWKVAAIPPDLLCRRVEITGPVNSTKMVIQMLSRNQFGVRADMAMLDFEDSMAPTFGNVLQGYKNVQGALRGDLSFSQEGKSYRLNPSDMSHPMVRVRGLHLDEVHIQVDGAAVAAGLCDLVTCLHLTAKDWVKSGKTPLFYVPKCQHHLEARWWNELFAAVEELEEMPRGSIKVTFLIETLEAAFQIEEILFELKERVVALNVGRWDKIFSDIKTLGNNPKFILRDRALINMQCSWMKNYAKRLIKICHERGALAIGGMAAFTPGNTEELRKVQEEKVFQDKTFEAELGHDGCWVSHPYFIGTALKAFTNDNQLTKLLSDQDRYPNLLPEGGGPYTMKGLRTNLRVGLGYMKGYLAGLGCVALDNLMEDLATLEISRAQVWQWRKHRVKLDDGSVVDDALVKRILEEEWAEVGGPREVCEKIFLEKELSSFLNEGEFDECKFVK